MFQLWLRRNEINFLLLSFFVLPLVSYTELSTSDCFQHSDCQTENQKSGVCWKGNCHCHPSFNPPNCRTLAGINGSFDTKRFEIIKQDKITGDEASVICRKKLVQLASIESMSENKYLLYEIEKRNGETNGIINDLFYIGLKYNEENRKWEWQDGTPLTYTPTSWGSAANADKLNNPSADDYVAMDQFGKWSIVDSVAKLSGLICQFRGIDEYMVEASVQLTYNVAEQNCRDTGYDLVSFYSWEEYAYTNALLRANKVSSAWIGLHYAEESIGTKPGWRWGDGSRTNDSLISRIPEKENYNENNRVEMLAFKNDFCVVDTTESNDTTDRKINKNNFICKTAPYKRDCGVLLKLDPSLPSGNNYVIRPRYSNYYAFCDMATDGGGYTYHITHGNYQLNQDMRSNIYDLTSIRSMCGDFSPLHIVSPYQVIELKRILADLGYDLEQGVVPLAQYSNGRYYALSDNSDITDVIISLEVDYNIVVKEHKATPRKPIFVGIGLGNTLTRFYIKEKGFRIVGLVCSTNNKIVPPDSFSVSYTSLEQHTTNTLQHDIIRDTIVSDLTVCTWFRYTDKSNGVVFSLTDKYDKEVLSLIIEPNNDRFVVKERAISGTDFGVHDGKYHKVCLVLELMELEIYRKSRVSVDGMEIKLTEAPLLIFTRINLAGSLILGDKKRVSRVPVQFLGDIDSLDIWDRALSTQELRMTSKPLYMPGNIVRWRDFNNPLTATYLIREPSYIYGTSRFKVGIGPSSLQWAKNYCFARGGILGTPRNDYEYVQILRILHGHKGWISVKRINNTLLDRVTSSPIHLTYVPSVGPDGDVALDEQGDFVTLSDTTRISFVCQFNVSEEMPNTPECVPEETVTKKGRFSWVGAVVNSSVKVLCPHGTIDPVFSSQGYAIRSCKPSADTKFAVWSEYDISKCNYANRRTQELDNLSKTPVTKDNAAHIASQVVGLTDNAEELDDTGLSLVTGIIENLVTIRDVDTTTDITKTLSNIMDVDDSVLESAQSGDKTVDRIINSLQSVAGNVASNTSQQNILVTKNIQIAAVKISLDNTTSLQSKDVSVSLPEAIVSNSDIAAYLITYKTNKLFMTNVTTKNAALRGHLNESEPSLPFLNTPVISAGIQDTLVRDLATPVSLTIPVYVKSAGRPLCVYYVASSQGSNGSESSQGSWQSDGLTVRNSQDNSTVTCVSDHMTSFAVIMTIEPVTHPVEGVHDMMLTTISYICLFVSLFGLVLTIFALSFQKTLWRLDMTKVHVCLSISLLFGYILFLVGIDQMQSRAMCISVAVLLHITFLIAFMWMAVEAYTLYLQFVKVFPSYTPNFLPKCLVVVVSVPLTIAGSFLVTGLSLNVTDFYEVEKYCWIKSYTLYIGFIAPILLIIIGNTMIFAYVTRNICRIVTLNKDDQKMSQFSIQLRAASSVLVVLGVTWILGAFTFGSASVWFQYAFTILNGLQGFAIFVFHVLLKPEVRKRWYNSIQGYTTSFSSNSHGLKSASFHRAHKYEVHQLNDNTGDVKLLKEENKKPIVNDSRFTYLSSSNDYATIESRPMSVSSGMSDGVNASSSTIPLIKTNAQQDTSPRNKRPLSTVASMEPPSTGTTDQDFSFSPVTRPDAWKYNPLGDDPLRGSNV